MSAPGDLRPRAATAGDAAELARLAGELGYPSAHDALAARLARATGDPDAQVFVVDGSAPVGSADRLAGWIEVQVRRTLESPDAAEITGLVVDPAARRGGVGRALVAAAGAWAVERGLARMLVRTNVARADSPRFYAGVGFRERKQQRVLALDLAPSVDEGTLTDAGGSSG